jgi:hypothetical protein
MEAKMAMSPIDPLELADRFMVVLLKYAGEKATLEKARTLLFVSSNSLTPVTDISNKLRQPLTTTSRQLIDLGAKKQERARTFG